jgi:hypothetical protein
MEASAMVNAMFQRVGGGRRLTDMNRVFPYANVIAGVLVLIVGFGFHWVGQRVRASVKAASD